MSSLKGDQLHSCGNILLLRALINNQINLLEDAQQTLDWTFWMLSRDWWIKALQASPGTCCCFQKLCSQHPLLCDHRTVTQRWKEAWEGRAGLSKMRFMFKSLRLKSFFFFLRLWASVTSLVSDSRLINQTKPNHTICLRDGDKRGRRCTMCPCSVLLLLVLYQPQERMAGLDMTVKVQRSWEQDAATQRPKAFLIFYIFEPVVYIFPESRIFFFHKYELLHIISM